MNLQYVLDHIKYCFNQGKLTIVDAEWYADQGYDVVCADGQVLCVIEACPA